MTVRAYAVSLKLWFEYMHVEYGGLDSDCVFVNLWVNRQVSRARRIDDYLVRWAMRKYKKLRYCRRKAVAWLASVRRRAPRLFAHWALVAQPSAG